MEKRENINYAILKSTYKFKFVRPEIVFQDLYGKFPDDKSMFDRQQIPDDLLDAVRQSSDLFLQLQENVIDNNLHYFNDPMNAGDLKDLAEIQRQVAEHYIEKYK